MSTSHIITPLTTGFLFSLSLIVALGPQTAFVLRQGVRRRHAGTVVALCTASDAILITAGVAGLGIALAGRHWLLDATRIFGATLLAAYGLLAARRAGSRQSNRDRGNETTIASRKATIAACLGLTWLNPAVYLDTVVLMGSVANAHPAGRWWFVVGAVTASATWFSALGFATTVFAPLLKHRHGERLLDAFVAATMELGALRLLAGL